MKSLRLEIEELALLPGLPPSELTDLGDLANLNLKFPAQLCCEEERGQLPEEV